MNWGYNLAIKIVNEFEKRGLKKREDSTIILVLNNQMNGGAIFVHEDTWEEQDYQ